MSTAVSHSADRAQHGEGGLDSRRSKKRSNAQQNKPRPNQQSGRRVPSRTEGTTQKGKQLRDRKRLIKKETRPSQQPEDTEPADFAMKVLPSSDDAPLQSYSASEIKGTGFVFDDPSSLGFLRRGPRSARPMPRFLIHQPRLLVLPPLQTNQWDQENQAKMLQLEASNSGSDYLGIYEEFQKMRDIERKKMEDLGLVDAENTAKDLNDAIMFHGSCMDMCPTFERVRRALENNVKNLEKDPVSGKITRERAVKAFSRPAAGQPPPIPSDVRPPNVLVQTLDYIVDNILPQLPEAHSFIWDRTRSIRQDFTYQNYFGKEAIDCNERIVRIHLLSLHIMANSEVEHSQQQELEQFNKALQTLVEIYDDVRNHGGLCPNEAEFRAYHLISHFRDPELERDLQLLPQDVFNDPLVQLAIRFRTLMAQNNVVERGYNNVVGSLNLFVQVFRLTYSDETPFLLASLLQIHFNEIRFYALKAISRSYHTKGRPIPATSLQSMLGFDTVDQTLKFVNYYEVDTIQEGDTILVDLLNKEKLESKYKLNSLLAKPKLAQATSMRLNSKIVNASYSDIVNSGRPNDLLSLPAKLEQTILHAVARRAQPVKTKKEKIDKIFDEIKPNASVETSGQAFGFGVPTASPGFGFGFGQPPPQQAGFGQQLAQAGFGQSIAHSSSGSGFAVNSTPNGFGEISGSGQGGANPQVIGSMNLSQFLGQSSSETKGNMFGSSVPAIPEPANSLITSKVEEIPSFSSSIPKADVSRNTISQSQNRSSAASNLSLRAPPLTKSNSHAAEVPKDTHSFKLPETQPKHVTFETPPQAPLAKSNVKPRESITHNPNFDRAARAIVDSCLTDILDIEILRAAKQLQYEVARQDARAKAIDRLKHDIFDAFITELVYEQATNATAETFRTRKLEQVYFSKLCVMAKALRVKREEAESHEKELLATSFQKPTIKRKHSNNSAETGSKRRAVYETPDTTFAILHNKQEQLQRLWSALPLTNFVADCKADLSKSPLAKDVKFLLLVEDWGSPYSKWLYTKFALESSADRLHFVKQVSVDEVKVSFETLPSSSTLRSRAIQDTAFLVFECGLTLDIHGGKYPSLEAKLARDANVLAKICQICSRCCVYKVQILCLVWGSVDLSLDLNKLLGVNALEQTDAIQNVNVLDMSAGDADIAKDLEIAFSKMGQEFSAHLTTRGSRLATRVRAVEAPPATQEKATIEQSEEAIRKKEELCLQKGRDRHSRNYLSRHLNANSLFERQDDSMMRYRDNSLANMTMALFNQSFLGNNTTLQRNMPSFTAGNILEESTPFGSPGRNGRSNHSKLEELKKLTAQIRARQSGPK